MKIINNEISKKIIEEYKLSGNNVRVLSRKYNISRHYVEIILKSANIKLKTCKEAKQEQLNKKKLVYRQKLFESDIAKKIIEDYQLPYNNSRTLRNKYKNIISRKNIIRILKHANIKLKVRNEVRCEHNKLKLLEYKLKLFKSDIGKKIIEEYQLIGIGVAALSNKYKLHRRIIKSILKLANVKLKTCFDVYNERIKLGYHIGKNSSMYGKTPPVGAGKCKWYSYNGYIFQGKYEFKFGLWLIQQNIPFICHKNIKKFQYQLNGRDRVYNPDFYLINDNVYIEIKGYFAPIDRQKMDIIKKSYPKEKIEIYDQKKLKELGVLNIHKKLNIELCTHETNLKKNTSMEEFIEQHEKDKIMIIEDHVIKRIRFKDIAIKYNTTFEIIRAIYRLYIKEYLVKFYNNIITDYQNGLSTSKICVKYNILKGRVKRILHKNNVNMRSRSFYKY